MTELHADLLDDLAALSKECFAIVESLREVVYPSTEVFLIEEYGRFLLDRSAVLLRDGVRSLANKTHGLKGIAGFVYPQLKDACHHSERVIKPLASHELLLDDETYALLRDFFLRVREYLEYNQGAQETLLAEGWEARFAATEERGRKFVRNNEELIKHLIEDRAAEDTLLTRKRTVSDVISVSRDGYERLLVLASQLHQLAGSKEATAASRGEALLSEFLQIHQTNKLNPLDLSRYERVVPKLAQQYGLRATLKMERLEITGEDRFLSAVHEITNHIVKNAITHGIEPPDERQRAGKPPTGTIAFSAFEDALSYYVVISDDGRGIDTKKVADKALSMGLVRETELAGMSRKEILRLIFAQGLTTAKTVDDNAGRGVGLNAVQEVAERFLGSIDLDSTIGKGTQWNFRFQKTHVALPCMLIQVHGARLALPEYSVDYLTRNPWQNESRYVQLEDKSVLGLIHPGDLLRLPRTSGGGDYVLVMRDRDRRVGFPASAVLGRKVLFIEPAPAIINGLNLFAGVSMVDGAPIMVIDVAKACAQYRLQEAEARAAASARRIAPKSRPAPRPSAETRLGGAAPLPIATRQQAPSPSAARASA